MNSMPFPQPRPDNPVLVLLSDLIDDTALFPPVQHAMAEAVRRYADHLLGPYAFALGRFVLPMHRLAEFEFAFARLPGLATCEWQLSVLAGINPISDSAVIKDFNGRHKDIRIVAVETKALEPQDVAARTAAFSPELEVWVEISDQVGPGPFIREIRKTGRGVKLRTGGTAAAPFPSPADVVHFLAECRAERVVAKVTAGLQDPVAGHYRVQTTPGDAIADIYRFLNLVLAAAVLRAGGSEAAGFELLNATDPSAFVVGPRAITWRGYCFGADELAAARRECLRSLGSGHFTQIIDELRRMDWL